MNYTVAFNKAQAKCLEEMAKELDTTKAAVLRAALSLLQTALHEKKRGNSIGVIRDDKVIKEIIGI